MQRIALLFVLFTACTSRAVDTGERAFSLRTDHVSYTLRAPRAVNVFEAHVIVRYENRTNAPVYFDVCGIKNQADGAPAVGHQPISDIIRIEGDTTRVDFRHTFACLGGAPRRKVGPAEVLQDTVWLVTVREQGPVCRPGTQVCRPPIDPSASTGRFRIHYRMYDRDDPNDDAPAVGMLPEAQRRTNVFEVRY